MPVILVKNSRKAITALQKGIDIFHVAVTVLRVLPWYLLPLKVPKKAGKYQ